MARSTARKRALNTLYEADEKGQDFLTLLDERIANPGAQTPLPDYAIEIVRGVSEHRRQIDEILDRHSTRWPLRRMHVIDRNILRIATWEILYNPEVPGKVAIDEALSLAKTLSDSDSPSFIHGLLSAVRKEEEERADHDEHAQARREEAERIAALAQAEAEKAESEAGLPEAAEAAEATKAPSDQESQAGQPQDDGEASDDGDGDGRSLDDLSLPSLGQLSVGGSLAYGEGDPAGSE